MKIRFFLIALLVIGFIRVQAQVVNYTSGSLDVDVDVVNACDGLNNGSMTFTVNASSAASATLSVILGPRNLLVAQVIPVGGSFTFDDGGLGLPAGSYDFIIADGTDNINTFLVAFPSVVVNGYTPINLNVDTQTDNMSCSSPNGVIEVTLTGGSGAYTYSVTGPGGFSDAGAATTGTQLSYSSLEGGTYSFTINDDNTVCVGTLDVVIADPSVTGSIDSTTPNTRCIAPFDGAIAASVTSGIGPYSYSWTGPNGFTSNSEDINGLESGAYSLTITDLTSGCTTILNTSVGDNTPTIGITTDVVTGNSSCTAPNGAISITPTGGSVYSYSWTGPGGFTSSSEDITGLDFGDYDITVTDVTSGCTATTTINVADIRPTIGITVDVNTPVTSCAASNGAISITPTGGTGYSYSWTGSGGFTSTSEDISALEPGDYDITVTDVASGCTDMTTVTVADNRPTVVITLDSNVGSDSCTTPNGSLSITPSGGTSYSYSWTGPGGFTSTSEDITGLEPGSYDVTVTEVGSSCTAMATFVVADNRPVVMITTDTNTDNTSCVAANGAISITASGGTSYSYSWTGPGGFSSTNEDITGLLGGSYDVTVTEIGSGCTAMATIVVVDNSPTITVSLDTNTDNTNCVGPNGALAITAGGGTGYSYAWTGPGGFSSTNEDLTGLVDGTYDVTVTDIASGCTVSDTYVVANSTPTVNVVVDSSTDNTSCIAPNGTIDITASGAGPYSYSWTGPGGFSSTNEDLTGLIGGTYTVIVTDIASGCTATTNTSISENQPTLIITVDNVTDNTQCFAPFDGSIDITIAGGGPGYTFDWELGGSTVSTNEDPTGLQDGSYDLTVTDITSGCTATTTVVVGSSAVNPTITLDTNNPNTSCGAFDGQLDVSISGGSGTYGYSWTGPGGFSDTNEDISSLEHGDYTITVTDLVSGCFSSTLFTVADNRPTISINVDASADNTNCVNPNGSIDITMSGGTGYTFAWSDGGAFNSTDEDLTDLVGGTYTLIATDVASGCTATTNVVINDTPVSVTITQDQVDPSTNCVTPNGAIQITVSGGTTYDYSWTGPGGFTSTNEDISNLSPGSYTVLVTDQVSGCTNTDTYTINDNTPTLTITVDTNTGNTNCTVPNGALDITVTGATNLTFAWSSPGGFASSNEDISGLVGDDYTLLVTDNDSGCTATSTITVAELASPISATGVVTDNNNCAAPFDGAIDITITGATSPTIVWTGPNGFTSTDEDISNLEPGAYSVNISESGCSTIENFNVADNSVPITVTGVTTPNSNCVGFDGTITLTVGGTMGGAVYSWTGPNGFTANTADITGLENGTYDVTVSENNCVTMASFVVGDNTPTLGITVDLVTDNTNCTVPNGAIDITATGATNYSYSWTSVGGFTSTNEDPTGLIGDTYTVVVTDDDTGCTTMVDVVVAELASPITLTETITDNTSCTAFNGAIDIVAGGVGGSEVYSWTGPNGFTAATASISGLEAGTYTITVTETGCTTIMAYDVLDNTPTPVIAVDATVDNTQCLTPFDGSISISVTGGSGTYSYSWTGPNGFISSAEDLTDIEGGDYTVLVTDLGNGCTVSRLITIAHPNNCGPLNCVGFAYSFNNTLPTCGNMNGEIVFVNPAYNGVPLVNYEVTLQRTVGGLPVGAPIVVNNPVGGAIPGLEAGDYTYDIVDMVSMNTCNGIVPLPSATTLLASARDIMDSNCFGEANGSAVLDASGSVTGNYFYSMDNGANWNMFNPGDMISNLPPNGTYDILVGETTTDPCPTVVTITVNNANPQIVVDATPSDATCANDDGEILINSVTGGTGVYTYELDGTPFGSLPGGNTFTGLTGGNHDFTVIDDSGCRVTTTITVGFPGFVNFSTTVTDPDCAASMGDNGSIEVNLLDAGTFDVGMSTEVGVPPTSFASVVSDGTNSQLFPSLTQGDYYIYVLPMGASCPDIRMVSIMGGPAPLTFDADVLCSGNAIEVELTNMTGEAGTALSINVYEFGTTNLVTSIPLASIPPSNSHIISGEAFLSSPAEYDIQLSQDQVLCGGGTIISSIATVDIDAPVSASVLDRTEAFPDIPNGTLTMGSFAGGLPPYDIQINLENPAIAGQTYSMTWEEVQLNTNLELEKIYSDMPPGRYLVEVADSKGCIVEINVDIDQDTNLMVPSIFTPNGDSYNDVFYIRNAPANGVELVISNRWGREVYSSKDYQNDWDGEGLADGIYFFRVIIGGDAMAGWVEIQRGPSPGN